MVGLGSGSVVRVSGNAMVQLVCLVEVLGADTLFSVKSRR